jgi:D-glycero-D-manno-heptose 1,7-bisphosphate phosphatase
MPLSEAVFLDRDGTINVEINYLHRPADLTFIPGAPEAIARLNAAGLLVVVVTNQAGIARGYYTENDMRALHQELVRLLARHGAAVDAFYHCPHHPDFSGPCRCRKPEPGMLLDAARRYEIDLRKSWLVGDTAGDLAAGQAAGCRTILVRTGYGAALESTLASRSDLRPPDAIVDALPEAVDYILARPPNARRY